MKAAVKLYGLAPLQAALSQVAKPSTQRRIVRGAVRKAGTPFNKVARQLAPRDEGKLKKSFKVRTGTAANGMPFAKAGSVSPVAHLMEDGTDERFRFSTVSAKSGGYPSTGRVTPRRFGSRAFFATRAQSMRIMYDAILSGVERELAKGR